MRKELVLHPSLTPRQKDILRSKSPFLLLTGPAGTAKTYTALARGFKQLYSEEVARIIIIRSAVPSRDIGFLPGTMEEKLDAYAGPYIDLIASLSPKFGFRQLVAKKMIEFHSTSFLRGLTFDDAYVLVDEYQNLSGHELETSITRVGENTHMVLCGDSDQSDLHGREAIEHRDVIATVSRMPSFEVHTFTEDEIVRSAFVREFYEARRATRNKAVLAAV